LLSPSRESLQDAATRKIFPDGKWKKSADFRMDLAKHGPKAGE